MQKVVLRALLPLVGSLIVVPPSDAAEPQVPLQALAFLSGDWHGTSPGGAGDRFRLELNGHVLMRTSLHEVKANDGASSGTMASTMTIYPDTDGKQLRAIYFDSEGHVIQYLVSSIEPGRRVQFESVGPAQAPKFRLTYQLADSKTLNAKFEMAMPNQPQEFHVIAEGDEKK